MDIVEIEKKLSKLLRFKVTSVKLATSGQPVVCRRCHVRIEPGGRYLLVEQGNGYVETSMCLDVVACEARIARTAEHNRQLKSEMDREVEKAIRLPEGL